MTIIKEGKVKYIVLALVYLYVLFMAWSAFGWMGIAYVVLVPVPFILFSYFIRRRREMGKTAHNTQLSLWSSPIPYFSIFFVFIIVFATTG